MIDRDLIRHGKEFLGHIDANRYEQTDDGGLYFPRAKAVISSDFVEAAASIGGVYDDGALNANLITSEGLSEIIKVALDGTSAKRNNFYLALFANNYTPVAGLTAANFASTAGEITSGTEGYSNATRPAWTGTLTSAGAMDNYAAQAAFTIATATQVNIWGAALLSDSVKGSTSGVLISAAKYANLRTEYNGNEYRLGYRVRIQ